MICTLLIIRIVKIAIAFSLMVGTAGLPHVIQRFYVVPKASDARWSVVWGLFFICILYWSAPAYAAFGKILSSNPEVGRLAKDAIVVYTAQLGNIHPLIVGLLAAGGVSAAFSTVSGLLVAGSSTFAHDLYVKVINPDAKPRNQLIAARLGTILMAIIVTIIALAELALIGELVAVAFSLAGCTIFPLFLLGIWWSGSNKQGAIAGLIAGGLVSVVALTYFIAGIAYKTIIPRLSTTRLSMTYNVDEKVSGLTAIAFSKITLRPVTIKLQGRYGENIADVLSISGFAVKSTDDILTGQQSYTPLRNLTFWGEVHTNGTKIQAGVFGGILSNMGTKEAMSDPGNAVYGLGTNIAMLWWVSPRVIFISNKTKFALEMEYTAAAYGSDYDLNYIPETLTPVANLRGLMSVIYSF